MNVLVIGNGGREHALAWSLLKSPQVSQLYCLPGNGGTACLEKCENVPLSSSDFADIAQFALDHKIGLVVVGPEVPLADGITDYLQAEGLKVFGPTRAGAQIEASKAWAKALMQAAGVPTAEYASFTDREAALAYLDQQGVPIVIKADGLAAGKGVTVAQTLEEAREAIAAAFGGQFGAAGQKVVIEACLQGEEVSILALTDGKTIYPLLPAQDHKRIGEGDTGANTGGMGAYAPVPLVTPELLERVRGEILEPTLKALQQEGIDYRGVLYAGLMITPAGDPKVIEFNCRFGDPETQVVLPLLETPLLDVLLACVEGRLAEIPQLTWKNEVAACVVMAAQGYPGSYAKGAEINGIDRAVAQGSAVFQAGTRFLPPLLLTDGGRVLAVTACGANFDQAFERAYMGVNCIDFAGRYFRRDIGYRVRATAWPESTKG
uniref:Phosphoribosylamine--glycine ligase n=1 Tax=Cyanothece sp. (strain PCC 7425 / ATCC 29141) TaxID=395961 RepID=B8HRF5_CYAP4